ncbi:MAG TPA: pitrilysin family protein [Methylocystis sp.]|nr:pitrilysin family protein [Methylocystis sp.]
MTAHNVVAAPKSRAEHVQIVSASCGVEAWLVESYAVPLISFEFSARGGASQDPAGKEGLANLLSGMLDEGAGERDSRAFHRAIEDLAAHLGFNADADSVSGHFQTLSRNATQAFELFAQALDAPRFDEDAIERVRGQICAGLKREAFDPETMAGKAFRRAAFPGHVYARPTRGELSTVETLTQADLFAQRARLLARDNIKIAVVGAIDAATLAAKLDALFGGFAEKADLVATPDAEIAHVGVREIVDLDVPQATLRFGRPGLSKTDPDYFAAVTVNHILGGGAFTSRLFNEVREKRGLAYSVYSQLHEYDHCPALLGAAATKNERAGETLEVIEAQCRELAEAGPSAEELDKAKKFLIGSYALRFDTSTKIASQLVRIQLDAYDPSYLDERNRRIEAVTLADAKRAAKRLLGDGKLLVAAVGRPEGIA